MEISCVFAPLSCQPDGCVTICVVQVFLSNLSLAVYVKLFALSAPAPPDAICQRSSQPLSSLRCYADDVLTGGQQGQEIDYKVKK